MMKNLKKQDCILLIKGMMVAVFLAWFFYRSWIALFPMLAVGGLFIVWEKKKAEKQKNSQLLEQFCECVLSVKNALEAGYAAENAFMESMKDMELMYGKDALILAELMQIKGGLGNNRPIEILLWEMGKRTKIEEIREFAEVFVITKRNGGNMKDIIALTEHMIRNKIEVSAEIQVLLASKRLEQKIMNLMPFLLVIYLQTANPGYFDRFFGNVTGAIMMTGLLVWYLIAYAVSEYVFTNVTG